MLQAQSVPPERPAGTIPVATDSSGAGLAAPTAAMETGAASGRAHRGPDHLHQSHRRDHQHDGARHHAGESQHLVAEPAGRLELGQQRHPGERARASVGGRRRTSTPGAGNGLSFWGSAPMALTGSLMWELFGESKPPAINDVLSTSITGIALGEPLYRLSLLVLDETSSGLDRLWREAVVFLLNPGTGTGPPVARADLDPPAESPGAPSGRPAGRHGDRPAGNTSGRTGAQRLRTAGPVNAGGVRRPLRRRESARRSGSFARAWSSCRRAPMGWGP